MKNRIKYKKRKLKKMLKKDIIENLILEESFDINFYYIYILNNAIKLNKISVLELLLKDKRINSNNKDSNYSAFCYACKFNKLEIIKLFLKDKDMNPNNEDNYALSLACENANIEVVKLLLNDPRVDPTYYYNLPIMYAAENGSLEVIKLLLKDPRVKIEDDRNEAMFLAFRNKNKELVNFLWSLDCVKKTLKNDKLIIYNELKRKDLENKLNNFI